MTMRQSSCNQTKMIGAILLNWRHIRPFEVEDQLDFRGLLDRQVGGLLAFENPCERRLAPSVHAGCYNAVVSIGSLRKRLPVAAKIALVTAGTMAEVPASPIPPGDSGLWTMWTSTAGASFIRRI
jgi:hypothetical protein